MKALFIVGLIILTGCESMEERVERADSTASRCMSKLADLEYRIEHLESENQNHENQINELEADVDILQIYSR